jgi:CRISPR-associated protein Csb2
MRDLTIGWEYLNGYAVATDPTRRDRVEWPPHPGRVFMALAAAWFETSPPKVVDGDHSRERRDSDEEGEALRWLETLGDPDLHLPLPEHVFERSPVTVYVPVNDKPDAHSQSTIFPHLGSVAIGRNRQPRTFPRAWVGNVPCFMYWRAADGIEQHRNALDRLCRKVTRIGHSSSLVRMWVDERSDVARSVGDSWQPDDMIAEFQVRKMSAGMLMMLAERFNESARRQHSMLSKGIEDLQERKKLVKGKGSKEFKMAIDAEIETLANKRSAVDQRAPLRPTLGLWSGYRRVDRAEPNEESPHTYFDTDVMLLVNTAGRRLPLESTLAVARALRDTVMSGGGVQPAPSWVSGHEANGQPLRGENGHLASFPLPFVSSEHADGHLLGVALAFPRAVDRRERARVLGKLLIDGTGKPRPVDLKLGRLGVWTVVKRDWTETRSALRPETWTAYPDGADTWASVTPVVLDRFPKAECAKDRVAWTHEVVGIVIDACSRTGLPEPVSVDIDTTSWHRGSPRAVCKTRLLRGLGPAEQNRDAALGEGFPPFPPKGANASRPQIHVWLRFDEPVLGPVLLGAGRYLGYGVCKPWAESRR